MTTPISLGTTLLRSRPALRLLSAFPVAIALAGCPGQNSAEDDSAKIKMATDLTQCRNDSSALKDKIAELTAEIQKLKAAEQVPDPTLHLPPTDLKANPPTAEKQVDGTIAPEQITKTVKANSGALRPCYEGGLKRNPNLQYVSMVNVRFSLKNTGNAAEVGFSPHTDGEMERCMSDKIAKWKFPAFTGGAVRVEAPVNLVAK